MNSKTGEKEQETKDILFRLRGDGELPQLASPPGADALFRGSILNTPKSQGKKQFFEVVEIDEVGDRLIAYCRSVTPKYFNSVLLLAGLIAGWFAVRYLLTFIGLGT